MLQRLLTNIEIPAITFGIVGTLVSAVPAAAQSSVAMLGAAPVIAQQCTILPPTGPNKSGTGHAWFNVRFQNTYAVPADRVVFLVDDIAVNHTITDAGTFTAGATIDHSFALPLTWKPRTGPPHRLHDRRGAFYRRHAVEYTVAAQSGKQRGYVLHRAHLLNGSS